VPLSRYGWRPLSSHFSSADDKDETNKSQIPVDDTSDYREQKGIPAGRPGAETDMAQTALFLACNQYMYGQVSTTAFDDKVPICLPIV
jgi:hypothetical protein